MTARNNVLEFKLNPPGYPWHIVEGDGETWLILRQKVKLPVIEIARVDNVILQDFVWRVFTKEFDKSLFQGTVRLTVYYSEVQNQDQELPQETWVDEHLARQLLKKDETCSGKNIVRKDRQVKTAFPSILLDGDFYKAVSNPGTPEKGAWHLEIPWQAWLYGTGKYQDPQIEKVHVAQVGLNTLLVEILIKIIANNQLDLLNFRLLQYGLLPREELIFKLDGQKIEKILGVTLQRALHQTIYDSESSQLQLRTFKEVSILFISGEKGGERILTASHLVEENQVIPFWPQDWQRPLSYGIFNKWLGIVKVAADKLLFQGDYLWFVRAVEETRIEKVAVLEERRKSALAAVAVPPRKKPGEKWLKKDKKEQPAACSRMAITIRL